MVEELKEQHGIQARKEKRVFVHLLLSLIILVVIVAVVVVIVLARGGKKEASWQAVFLTNGQTYFGHITKTTNNFVVLEDVYYLQAQTVPPEKEGEQPTQQLTLAKLGQQEFHGPENEMKINRDHILFIENLRSDSQVVQTIEQIK